MTVFCASPPGLQGDYKGDYSPAKKHACCSQAVYRNRTEHERKTTDEAQPSPAVVTPVVSQNAAIPRTSGPLTTDYSFISKEEYRERKTLAKEYAREGSHRSQPPALTITAHALQRYRERIADLPDAAILAHLDTPTVRTAIRIGAPYVRLATRHRIVIQGSAIVTMLPADTKRGYVARWGR